MTYVHVEIVHDMSVLAGKFDSRHLLHFENVMYKMHVEIQFIFSQVYCYSNIDKVHHRELLNFGGYALVLNLIFCKASSNLICVQDRIAINLSLKAVSS